MTSMSHRSYAGNLHEVMDSIRSAGIGAPIFVAIASMCHNGGSDAVRSAQAVVIRERKDLFQGANSDSLDRMRLRYDGCHFSDEGLNLHAELWFTALTNPQQ